MKTFFFTTLAVIILPFFLVSDVYAQTVPPCGNIIGPNDISGGNSVTKPITDCLDPFAVTTSPASPYVLLVEGNEYQNGAVIPVPDGETNDIRASGTPTQMNVQWQLYKHDGNDYRYIDLEASEMTLEYFESYIPVYFSNPIDRDLYLQIVRLNDNGEDTSVYLYNEDGTDKIDESTGETVVNRLQNFYQAAENDFVPISPKAGLGTYTLVITEYSVYQTQNSFWDKIRKATPRTLLGKPFKTNI